MKKFYQVSLAIALCLLLALPLFPHASANENEVIDYASLFAQAQFISIESNHEFVVALNEAFAANPVAFLDALSNTDANTITTIVYHWITDKTLDDIYELLAFTSEASEGTEYYSIISALNQEIGIREYASVLEPYMQHEIDNAPFSVAIVKRFIDLNILNETFATDEEFNHLMATAYESNPQIFAETISAYSQAEIKTLAKCVSADYAKFNKTVPAVTSNLASTKNQEIINLIQGEIAAAINSSLIMEEITIKPPSAEIMSSCIPTIGAMVYTTAPLQVGQTEVLNITFTESTQVSSLRQWYVEVYQVIDSTYILKKAQTIAISPGSTSASINFTLSFSNPCTFYTHVKVYSMQGGSQLTRRTGAYPDTVNGYWYINVNFTANRTIPGTLRLYNCNGALLLSANCLGLSASGLPATQTNGHTPTGTYTGILSGPDSPVEAYGPYKVVAMTGVSGQIVDECSHRWGIGIHGGRSQEVLQATDGCIRVFNTTQLSLQTKIEQLISSGHYSTGYVYVYETSG